MMLRTLALLLTATALTAPAQEEPAPPAAYVKDSEATQARPGPGGHSILWMNPLKWTWVKSDREDTEIYYHNSGTAQARLIATNEAKTPREQLADTLERVRKIDPKARIGFEEKRIVNGAPMLCVQIVASEDTENEMVYYGYLYGDGARSVQLFAITPRARMTDLYVDLTSLLNGLQIAQKGTAP